MCPRQSTSGTKMCPQVGAAAGRTRVRDHSMHRSNADRLKVGSSQKGQTFNLIKKTKCQKLKSSTGVKHRQQMGQSSLYNNFTSSQSRSLSTLIPSFPKQRKAKAPTATKSRPQLRLFHKIQILHPSGSKRL